MTGAQALVSVIIPVYNSDKWIEECLESLSKTDYRPLEVCIFNDSSTDDSHARISSGWPARFDQLGIQFVYTVSQRDAPGGVGYARNQAVKVSSGEYLCFLDSDDAMRADRVRIQV